MKKIFLILFSLVVLSLLATAQPNDAVKKYIDTYKELSISEEMRTGVPAAITLAQGILESESGQSELSLASNNHFGIKCKSDWNGATIYHDDDTKAECFRSYATVEDSYRDHSDFLKNRPNYIFLFTIDPTDYAAWAYGLKKAGYATSPVYAQMLLKIISDNRLQDYTLIALERIKNGSQRDLAINKNNTPIANDAILVSTDNASETTTEFDLKNDFYPSGIFTINQSKVIYATAGTSLFALASNNNISYAKLLEFNNLMNVDVLQNDQLVFLEKKPKKSNRKEYHIVEPNETIETIAQMEGVQLESLCGYNKIQKGMQPATGEKVYLSSGKPSYYPRLVKK